MIFFTHFALAADRFSAFENRSKKDTTRFSELENNVTKRWGRFLESTVPRWVKYSEDLQSETSVDFEKGFVEISVLKNKKDLNPEKRLKEELLKVLNHRPAKQLEPLLQNQLQQNISTVDLWKNVKSEIKKTKIFSKQTDQYLGEKVSLYLPLAPNHIQKRAKVFLPLVIKYAKIFNLDPSLVLAIIHTESFFNPYAKSSVAYGLMQLVPTSGARDAYRKRFGRDKIVKPEYLYNPEKNIELGTQYIKILHKVFAPIKDQNKIASLSICAYNTGAGNVALAFIKQKSPRRAFNSIRKLTPQNLYHHLIKKLPYHETRDYLKRVIKRQPYYRQISSSN